MAARIIAIAEAYDAIQRAYSYQAASSSAEALAEIEHCAATQFDPALVRALSIILAEQQSLQLIS